MNISIVGTGNVAHVLAILCKKSGHHIAQIISRNEIEGRALADLVQATYINLKTEPDKNVDLCIFAIADNAFPEGIEGMNFGDKLVVHTAGSISMSALQTVSTNYGVLYPLQSLRKEMEVIPEIPFLIEASSNPAFELLQNFAISLSNNVHFMEEQKRYRLHAAAVIASNFTNYLYTVANTFCDSEAVDFNLLKPLIIETAARIAQKAPSALQTGPAVRKDIRTLEKHLQLFSKYPKMKTLYTRMTDSIMND